MKALDQLKQMAQAWGGDIIQISQDEYLTQKENLGFGCDGLFSDAPFVNESRLGVRWEEKKVVYTTIPSPFEVIDEMGHVFASLKTPEQSDEYDFFGWELAMVRHIGANFGAWVRYNRHYGLEDIGDLMYPSLSDLTYRQRKKLFQERVLVAEGLGLIKNGVPQAIR